MATVTSDEVKALRDETGISVMQCKKALEEAGGDKAKALLILQKKSTDIAAKKADRSLGAGVVASYVHNTGGVGSMVVLSCETDFVAKNPEFKQLAYDIAMHVAAVSPKYVQRSEVSETELAKVTEMFGSEVAAMKKPEDIKKKVLEGKIDTFLKERTLLDQPYVKNPDITVGTLVSQAVQKFGEKTEVTRMIRFSTKD